MINSVAFLIQAFVMVEKSAGVPFYVSPGQLSSHICNYFSAVPGYYANQCNSALAVLPHAQVVRLSRIIDTVDCDVRVAYSSLITPFIGVPQVPTWVNYIDTLYRIYPQPNGPIILGTFFDSFSNHISLRRQAISQCGTPKFFLENPVHSYIDASNIIYQAPMIGRRSLMTFSPPAVGRQSPFRPNEPISSASVITNPAPGVSMVSPIVPELGTEVETSPVSAIDSKVIPAPAGTIVHTPGAGVSTAVNGVPLHGPLSVAQPGIQFSTPAVPLSVVTAPNVVSPVDENVIVALKPGVHESKEVQINNAPGEKSQRYVNDKILALPGIRYHDSVGFNTYNSPTEASFEMQVINRVLGVPNIPIKSVLTGNQVLDNAAHSCVKFVKALKNVLGENVVVKEACSTPDFVVIDQLRTSISGDGLSAVTFASHFKNWRDLKKEYLMSLYEANPGFVKQQDFIRRVASTEVGQVSFTQWSMNTYKSLYDMSVTMGPIAEPVAASSALITSINAGLNFDDFQYILQCAGPSDATNMATSLLQAIPHSRIPVLHNYINGLRIAQSTITWPVLTEWVQTNCLI